MIYCDIQLFDAQQIIYDENKKVLAVVPLHLLGEALVNYAEGQQVVLNGYEEIVQGVIEQAKLIDKNIEIEVNENV